MKKLLLFLICIMPFLGIGQAEASSGEPVKKVVLVNVPKGNPKLTRDVSVEYIQCYYYSGALMFAALDFVSEVEIIVENLSTNEVWFGEFDARVQESYLMEFISAPGTYEITCTTSSGDVYSGTLTI